MICFTIALRSKESTNNWEQVLKNFNNTLHSIFNQTNEEFEVYVGCNEVPELYDKYDERLHFLTADLPIPQTWEEKCRDRSWKLLLCAQEIRKEYSRLCRESEGVYVFPVDADDYVNHRIAEWCVKNPNANGFKSKTGYKWIKGQKHMVITKYYGGSMNIMKMYKEDLPAELPSIDFCSDEKTAMALTKRYPIRWYDIEVYDKFKRLGRPLSTLPFRSTVYVLGTGDNISKEEDCNIKNAKRFHPVAVLRKINPFDKRLITKKIKNEFGFKD